MLYENAMKLFYQIQSQQPLVRGGKFVNEKARILIVDDDESIRKVLATILEDEGYTVESVETAKKGIEKSESSFYNLALIDIHLPDMEGVELLVRTRVTKP